MQIAVHASVRLSRFLAGPLVGEAYACLGMTEPRQTETDALDLAPIPAAQPGEAA